MKGATGSRKRKKKTKRSAARPNPRRQAVYAAIALAAVLGGYGVGVLVEDEVRPPPSKSLALDSGKGKAEPWYATQPPPPSLITAPDAPLFPDPSDEPRETPALAYEEALPQEVYEPPPPKPASTPQTSPAPAEIAAVPAVPPPMPGETPPWRRFAVAAPDTGGRPMIAVVIDDMGVDRKRTARTIALVGPLTLSFLTYADDLERQTAAARKAGHELLLHVSMEPGGNVDPGPNVLLVGLGAEELRRRLRWGLSRFDTYVGINNHMGSKFTAAAAGMAVVMEELKARGLLFLDSRTSGATVGAKLARRFGVPFAERNVFLDNVNQVAAVNARLAEVERLARRKGFAIAIGHPRDATITALTRWLDGIAAKGFALVPLSAVVGGPGAGAEVDLEATR